MAASGNVARFWKWLRRRFTPAAPTQLPDGSSGRVAARARFWAELREGQREAEAAGGIRDARGIREQ